MGADRRVGDVSEGDAHASWGIVSAHVDVGVSVAQWVFLQVLRQQFAQTHDALAELCLTLLQATNLPILLRALEVELMKSLRMFGDHLAQRVQLTKSFANTYMHLIFVVFQVVMDCLECLFQLLVSHHDHLAHLACVVLVVEGHGQDVESNDDGKRKMKRRNDVVLVEEKECDGYSEASTGGDLFCGDDGLSFG